MSQHFGIVRQRVARPQQLQCFGIFITLLSGAALAQSSDAPTGSARTESTGGSAARDALQEIIVTARRTEESVQDVPVGINVFDNNAIWQNNISEGNDLAKFSPGLTVVGYQDRTPAFSIHGQGQVYLTNPGVVPYYAEVPDFSPYYYDLSSIQVLKGPQGTLFGRNTTGGAILLTPAKPSNDFSGYAEVRAGQYSRTDFEGAIGGAIIDDVLSVRLAGRVLRRDGFTRNRITDQELDDVHNESGRLSVVFKPVESLENYTLLQYDHADENGAGNVLDAIINQSAFAAQMPAYFAAQRERGPRVIENDGFGLYEYERFGVINTTSWQMNDSFTIKNIAHWQKTMDADLARDLDGSPFRILQLTSTAPKNISKTDEIQLQFDNHAGISAVAGYYYEDTEDRGVGDTFVPITSPFPTPTGDVVVVPAAVILHIKNESDSKAYFLHGTWDFLEDWSLSGGYRHTKDKRTVFTGRDFTVPDFGIFFVQFPYARFSTTSSADTWDVSLSYKFTPDVMSYVTVRRGYKAGGVNAIADPTRIAYEPEFVTDYNVGLKSKWNVNDVQIRANTDVYYDVYKDIQRSITSLDLNPAVSNAAKAKIWGIDVDLAIVPSEYFDIAINYALLKTKYDRYSDPLYGDLSDGDFPLAPEHQLSVTPAAHMPLPGEWGSLSAQATVFYQSDFAIDVNNKLNGNPLNDAAIPGSLRSSFTRLDTRLEWSDVMQKPLDVAFVVRNATNKDYKLGGTNNLVTPIYGVACAIYGEPRMWSIEAQYKF